jgi:hypothetical protein
MFHKTKEIQSVDTTFFHCRPTDLEKFKALRATNLSQFRKGFYDERWTLSAEQMFNKSHIKTR